MTRRFVARVVGLGLVGLVVMTGVASAASRQDDTGLAYTAVDLGGIKEYPGTALFAMNAKGIIVGQGYDPTTYQSRAAIYRSGKIRAMIKGEKGGSSAQDINASNQIVGYTMDGMTTKATLWDGEEATALVESDGSTMASAINDEGLVVGWVMSATGYPTPFLWEDGEVTALPLLEDGDMGSALNINAEGVAVGYSLLAPVASASGNIPMRATSWTDGEATDLGTVGGEFSQALGINASGQIVGRSTTGPDQYDQSAGSHATLWDGDEIIDLGTLADGEVSVAAAINAKGLIVGRSTTAPDQSAIDGSAFLWADGTMYDINELIEGDIAAALFYAYDINDDGLIVASGRVDGIEHSFLLTPIED